MEVTLNGKTFTIGSQSEGKEQISELMLNAYCTIDDVAEKVVVRARHLKHYNEWMEWFNETYVQMCGVSAYDNNGFYFQGVVYYEDYMCMLHITPTKNYIYFI